MSARAKAKGSACVICDSAENIEQNHAGGRNYVAWFTMPFCREHHLQFHALLRTAGVDLEYTPDPQERMIRALKAISICQWMLLEALQRAKVKNEGSKNNVRKS
jgi:hypothetical protein